MKEWPALFAGLGLVAFGFGILSAILALFNPAFDPSGLSWVWINLALGAMLLIASATATFEDLRERMRTGQGRRAGTHGTSALASAILGILILAMLAFLSVRYTKRFDWSEQKVHTLTQQTRELLERLDRDIDVTAFFQATDAPSVRDLLQRYEYESDHFKLHFVDPNERPDLVASLGVAEEDLARGLVRMAAGESVANLKEFSEAEITNNLVKLTRGGAKKVYLVTEHNERPFEGDEGQGKEGYSRIVDALRAETYVVEPLLLSTIDKVPEDANAVILAGPTRPYLDHEHEVLRRYLGDGGALMVLIDPRAKTDLYDDLRAWGVVMGDDVIVDRLLALFGSATSPLGAVYAPHPITEKLRERTIFPMVRSVVPTPAAEGQLEVIVSTSDQSWAERDLESWMATGRATYTEGEDLEGPVPVAIAGRPLVPLEEGEEITGSPRLVVFGDSDFVSNEYVDAYLNRDLFLNAVNWLMGDVELITVRPNVSRASRFYLTPGEERSVQFFSLFFLPEAIAVVGVLTWWVRRRRPES